MTSFRGRSLQTMLSTAFSVLACLAVLTGDGNFTRHDKISDADNELDRLGERINQPVGTVEKTTIESNSMLEALADGDLTHRVSADDRITFSDLAENANITAGRLTMIIDGIQNTATEAGSAASEMGSGTKNLDHRTGQAAFHLEETAASTEKLSVAVKQNAWYAESANQPTSAAIETASEDGNAVEQAFGMLQIKTAITDDV